MRVTWQAVQVSIVIGVNLTSQTLLLCAVLYTEIQQVEYLTF